MKVQNVWLDYVKFVCGLMAISRSRRRLLPPPSSSSSTTRHCHCPPPQSLSVIVHRPTFPSAARRRSPRHPPPSKSSAAGPPSLFATTAVMSRSCIVSRGLKISSNICLGPLAPPFHFFDPEPRYSVPNSKETPSAVI